MIEAGKETTKADHGQTIKIIEKGDSPRERTVIV